MEETIPGTHAMGQRLARAHTDFVALIVESGFTQDEAEIIFAVYRKHKCVKLEAGIGRYTVKHGGFWDKAALFRALEMGR